MLLLNILQFMIIQCLFKNILIYFYYYYFPIVKIHTYYVEHTLLPGYHACLLVSIHVAVSYVQLAVSQLLAAPHWTHRTMTGRLLSLLLLLMLLPCCTVQLHCTFSQFTQFAQFCCPYWTFCFPFCCNSVMPDVSG